MFAAEQPSLCGSLHERKWHWQALYGDSLPNAWEQEAVTLPAVSLASCWNCGIWVEDAFVPSPNQEQMPEAPAYDRARCLLALGMYPEALGAFRDLIRQHPQGPYATDSLQNMFEILFQDGNDSALIRTYTGLDQEARNRLSHGSLYLVSQSFYRQGQDAEAMALVQKIPPKSNMYPYAVYAKAQIAFRNGQEDQAFAFLETLLERSSDRTPPNMLRERALLTSARILFQRGRYEEAMDHFRRLSRSRFFLPEALMGMGWCYQALGDPSRAASFFQTVEETSLADTATWARAKLEIALLYSKAGSHSESLRILSDVQEHLQRLIQANQRYGKDHPWLAGLARDLLSGYNSSPKPPLPTQAKSRVGDLRAEMEFHLQKESYTSSRMKRLLDVREALDAVRTLLDRLPDASIAVESIPAASPFQYPPLEASRPSLEPGLTRLLDASLALMDTEYRSDQAERFLELKQDEDERERHRERLAFYSSLFQKMLLPQHEGEGLYAFLDQLESSVRNLPYPLEVRRKTLTKLLYTRRTLERNGKTLQRWNAGMTDASESGRDPLRLVMLRAWITLVRTLVELRTWEDRSPAVLMKEGNHLQQGRDSSTVFDMAQSLLSERLDQTGHRLELLMEHEIARIHEKMLRSFEEVLAESQLFHAEALLYKQETLLETFKSSPAQAE